MSPAELADSLEMVSCIYASERRTINASAEALRSLDALQVHAQNARAHLRVALAQVIPTDDAVVIGHVRAALYALGGAA